ncbi:aromatic amino acid DMT transporter YddG [Acinetobacter baumannii]|nr:aromatic amino acid DMT transporter YddG [Acinetobacter baumannii]EKT9888954.1 aromatic amino acid DMT transporter YddG [Acinetobacter baumannii]EKT9961553.1 aromatic amino acid DMT transporter YddG [Acinetobacter baumannii]EKW3628552.1 aromatic amino acid DMT transporter YddG [Acinetobacter baumannii]EKW3727411.1 aromatic amino acid DMT transporter YddG [Acinetobacter baumannii]
MSKNLATLIGLSAILMWASMVGFVKHITTAIGPDVGITLIYSLSALLLLIIFRVPNFKLISKKYLILGAILFIAYELCFSFALAYSKTAQQAIEVSIVNYLWPSLTVLAFVIFRELKFNVFIILGLLISISGIIFIQTGNGDFSLGRVVDNFHSNPLSYILAFIGAIIWAFYCVLTKKMSKGQNPISIFFLGVAITLWLKLLFSGQVSLPSLDLNTILSLIIASAAIGLGYAAWNIGIIHGNITMLVVASYFTPIISSLLAMLVLQTELSISFWQGTAMVTAGSLICWLSTNWTVIRSYFRIN